MFRSYSPDNFYQQPRMSHYRMDDLKTLFVKWFVSDCYLHEFSCDNFFPPVWYVDFRDYSTIKNTEENKDWFISCQNKENKLYHFQRLGRNGIRVVRK